MKILQSILAVLIIALMVGACSEAPQTEIRKLEGSSWVLTEIKSNPALAGVQVTLEFKEGQAGGNASCNSYSGTFKQEGSTLSFGPMMSTLMACEQDRMDQETTYLKLLGEAASYQIAGNELTIFTDAGESLTFQER